tara:strand:+ start:233 stop:544 length:312 start_codon:yes stop_codon:yes gene_type:complete
MEKKENLNKILEKLIRDNAIYISEQIDRTFQNFTKLEEKGLTKLTYSQMTEMAYIMGQWHGSLDCGKDVFGVEPPDYSKSKTRLEIMKDKLYKSAEKKSIGLD